MDLVKSQAFQDILENNKKRMADIKLFEEKPITAMKRNLVFVAGSVFGLFCIGMFASEVIKGGVAIFVSLVLGLVSYYIVRTLMASDELIRQKTKNYMLKKMVEEAKNNSIEQLDNQVLINAERLQEAKRTRDMMGALVKKLEGKINPKNKEKPTYAIKVKALKTIKDAYAYVCEDLVKAEKADQRFIEKVADHKDMEAFASIANQFNEMLSGSGIKGLEDMLSLAAFEQIEDDFNFAITAIENKSRSIDFAAA